MLVPSQDWTSMIKKLEIKELCSLILTRTIDDTDKYQSGLTKIFFHGNSDGTPLHPLGKEPLSARLYDRDVAVRSVRPIRFQLGPADMNVNWRIWRNANVQETAME